MIHNAARATAWFYVAVFLALGAHLPFWPLWLKDWGLSEAEAGLYLGLAIAARIVAGVLGPWLADLTGRRRTALALTAALGAAGFLAHLGVGGKPALLALTLLTGVCLSTLTPLGDALGAAAARAHGFAYARARAAGSAAFLAANLAAGWAVAALGVDAALWWIVASLVLVIWFAARHPGGAPGGDPKPRPADALRLLRARPFLLAAAAAALLQASHGPLYAYGSIQWRAQGFGEGTIGALWAIGVAAEVALMFAAAGWIARLGPWGAFALAGAAGMLRWSLLALAPGLAALWPLQLLHAVTFAPAHLGLIAFVSAAVPASLTASAQGLAAAGAGGLAMAGATFAAAWAYPLAGAGAFLIGAALSAAGLLAALALRRVWDGGTLALQPSPRRM